ncbi:hypothetical protein Hypma_001443 [Hypsizygus marmoreus]|uniref:Uncharacterized protein n=1 Tax=Hypsizygus marmoreus TaxID=39966 RepID=A0A369K0G8_HYPMA|nr:hypothetical protein Hypma_001443 [Hypsizygus marmoreus]
MKRNILVGNFPGRQHLAFFYYHEGVARLLPFTPYLAEPQLVLPTDSHLFPTFEQCSFNLIVGRARRVELVPRVDHRMQDLSEYLFDHTSTPWQLPRKGPFHWSTHVPSEPVEYAFSVSVLISTLLRFHVTYRQLQPSSSPSLALQPSADAEQMEFPAP